MNTKPTKNRKTGIRLGVFKKIKAAIAPNIAKIAGKRLKATERLSSLDKNIDPKNPQAKAHKPPVNA
jgi:hypothetical protein